MDNCIKKTNKAKPHSDLNGTVKQEKYAHTRSLSRPARCLAQRLIKNYFANIEFWLQLSLGELN